MSLFQKFKQRVAHRLRQSEHPALNFIHKRGFDPLRQLFYKRMHSQFFYIQIGANDGVSYDPIYPLVTAEKVKGIAIEPVPDIFEKLKLNYASQPQVTLLNKAIHATSREMTMYRVNPLCTTAPEYTKGTPSFNKAHHQLSNIDDKDILEIKVPCISWEELLKEYGVKHIDLLQIDTEGYDFEIIKSIDFNHIKPAIISFEHGVRSGIHTWDEFNEILQLLYLQEYEVIIQHYDAIAYR